MGWPWRLAMMVDPRVSEPVRAEIMKEFWETPEELLDPLLSVRFRNRLRSVEDLRLPHVVLALRTWVASVRLSIASVEWCHGRNRRRSHESNSWASFVSQYLNMESLIRLDVSEKSLQRKGMRHEPAGAIEPAQANDKSKRKPRILTPLDIFRFEYYDQQAALCRVCNPAKCWPQVHSLWDALPDEMKEHYVNESELGIVRKPRAKAKPQARLHVAAGVALLAIDDLPAAGEADVESALVHDVSQFLLIPKAPTIEEMLSAERPYGVRPAARPQASERTQLPLSVEQFAEGLSCRQDDEGGRPSIKASAKAFIDFVTRIGKPDPGFPKEVEYPRRFLGSWCTAYRYPLGHDVAFWDAHSKIERMSAEFIKTICKPAEIFGHDVLVAIEATHERAEGGVATLVIVAHACSSIGRIATTPERHEFIVCSPTLALPHSYEETILRYARHPVIACRPVPWCRGEPLVGRLWHETSQGLATYVLESLGRGSTIIDLRLRRVKNRLFEGDGFRLLGVDAAFDMPKSPSTGSCPRDDDDDAPPPADDDMDWAAIGKMRAQPTRKRATRQFVAQPPRVVAPNLDEMAVISDFVQEDFFSAIDQLPHDSDSSGSLFYSDDEFGIPNGGKERPLFGPASAAPPAPAPAPASPFAPAPTPPIGIYVVGGSSSSSSGGPVAEVTLDFQRANCMELLKLENVALTVCDTLQFRMGDDWRIFQAGRPSSDWDVAGVAVGQIRCTFSGQTLDMQCNNPKHKEAGSKYRCKFMLQCTADMSKTEAALCKWLIAGITMTKDEHAEARVPLRAEWKKNKK